MKSALMMVFIVLFVGGCAIGGAGISPDGDAIGGNAQNVFNINISGMGAGGGGAGGYPQYRVVPLTNYYQFGVTVWWYQQYINLGPGETMNVYFPLGTQTIKIVYPNGQYEFRNI